VGSLVIVENVYKTFVHEGREVPILKGIDLTIDEGEMLCIVGPSGAGKSTLLHLLGTLDLPTAGRIAYDGEDVTTYSSARLAEFRNHSIGFVFQFHHLLGDFSAVENVMLPLLVGGHGRAAARRRAAEVLDRVGLSDRLQHRPGQLSGGEQQRVAVARALVGGARLLLADEPTGNLDRDTAQTIVDLLDSARDQGVTIVMVTHDPEMAARATQRVRLRDGRVVDS